MQSLGRNPSFRDCHVGSSYSHKEMGDSCKFARLKRFRAIIVSLREPLFLNPGLGLHPILVVKSG